MRVLILSHRDVLAALPPQACAEAMAAVLAAHARGGTYQPLRSVMVPPDAAGFMGLMPCWRGRARRHGRGVRAQDAVHDARQSRARPRRASGHSSRCSTARPACRPRSLTPPRSPLSAPPRSPRSRPACWPAAMRGRSRSSAPGRRRERICRRSQRARLRQDVRLRANQGARRSRGRAGRRNAGGAERRLERRGSGPRRRRGRDGDQRARAGARGAAGSSPAPTSTRSAPALRRRARSTPPPWPRARCSATAASRCATRPVSSSSRWPRA